MNLPQNAVSFKFQVWEIYLYHSVGKFSRQKNKHYKNTPIQIYWKFYHQKKIENFQIKILIFFLFLLKT